MTVPSRLLQQCFQEARNSAAELIARSTDAAIASLQAAEKASGEVRQRDRLALAWWGLLQNKIHWGNSFPQQLHEALEAAPEVQSSRPSLLGESSLLSLVEDEAVNESLESARLVHSLMPAVEQQLGVLDALMSSVLGLPTVQPERNPMRPSVFVRALGETMAAVEQDPEMRGLWLRHMGTALGSELQKLYERIALMLQRANVREAGYRVRLAADGGHSTRSGGLSTRSGGLSTRSGELGGGHASASHWADLSGPVSLPDRPSWAMAEALPPMHELARLRSAVDNQVFHEFLNHGGSHFDQALTADYYEQASEELAAIEAFAAIPVLDESMILEQSTRYRDLPVVDRPAREVGTASQLSSKAWGEFAAAHERARVLIHLKQKAQRVAQAVGLDLVRTLVSQVARDPLLLAPVREAVVALEPALLRLALANPRFFNEDHHPGRRLVESVAQRSFKYNDEFLPEFDAFFEPVRKAFSGLNASATSDPQVFADALAGLQGRWEQEDRQEQQAQDPSLKAIRFAEERQALADQIAWELSQRPDVENAPGVILDFLYGPWSLVIASAQLNDSQRQADPGGYRKTVSNLLWSVKKEVTLKLPKQLFAMVPGMLANLHEGLDMLGKTREETKPFFDALMRLHQPVLGLRRARIRHDAQNSALEHAEATDSAPPSSMNMELDETLPATPEQRKPRPQAQPWLAQRELEAAGFQDTQPSDHGELESRPAAEPMPEAHDAAEDLPPTVPGLSAQEAQELQSIQAEAILAGLREGDWVDLYSHREWLRAQLVWASNKGTLFMFVSHGGRPHSMTKRSCERLIANRQLRPIDAQGGVVKKALKAMKNAETHPAQARAVAPEAA
ncbi:DUF1631 family protein [Hydrogenophaga sp.]|uniref:DUF1631 family protein n=1 Tax=Hydrogenophaga sp. TaxID=1904254 RepID=UPI002604BE51|nr:DUF1631 family protein [Hydrogenophaga sp.]MCW5652702.1 DUF1631 family protein [Hydrogenophaga sp.]